MLLTMKNGLERTDKTVFVPLEKGMIYLFTPVVIQRSLATKDLAYIHVYPHHCVTEILPPFGRLTSC